MTMQCGIFMTPYNPPDRTPRQVFDWALDIARIADEAGYADYMIGEHYTLGWENIPMPDAIIAACAQTTKHIRFAPMAHLLPYHDPATLAIRIGWLSQVMEGRYFLGVAPGGHHTDAILHGYENISGLAPRQLEALHLMERVWERKPFVEKGQYFQAGFPGSETMPEYDVLIADNSPYGGRDKLEIAVTGLSMNSSSMKFAGERDYSPISFWRYAANEGALGYLGSGDGIQRPDRRPQPLSRLPRRVHCRHRRRGEAISAEVGHDAHMARVSERDIRQIWPIRRDHR